MLSRMASRPVIVIDFGAQYAQLIARRVREAHVYSEIMPHTASVADVLARDPQAIILSGGPSSVYADDAPGVDPTIFTAGPAVFGMCYGFQLMAASLGGEVSATGAREYGRTRVRVGHAGTLLGGIPTIIYGYFALLFLTPLLQRFFPELPGFNLLSAGLVMGVMIIPYVASLSEDAMRAVPMALREGSYATGATRLQTALRVVVPAAMSGIASAYILGVSRAVGETMILAVAAGMQPNLTWNPAEPAATITSYIVQVALGDLPHGSIGYQTIFAAGLTLILITLCFNILGQWLRKKFRENY